MTLKLRLESKGTPDSVALVDIVTGEAVEGIVGARLTVSANDSWPVQAHITLELAGVDVIGDVVGATEGGLPNRLRLHIPDSENGAICVVDATVTDPSVPDAPLRDDVYAVSWQQEARPGDPLGPMAPRLHLERRDADHELVTGAGERILEKMDSGPAVTDQEKLMVLVAYEAGEINELEAAAQVAMWLPDFRNWRNDLVLEARRTTERRRRKRAHYRTAS